MSGLDTNVLVRWLVDDDRQQTARFLKLLDSSRTARGSFFVPSTVILELEWVLRARYRFDKNAVLQAFNALLETQELEFQAEDALEWALHLYRQSAAEFADCMHAAQCGVAGKIPLLTFDVKAARLPDVELLET